MFSKVLRLASMTRRLLKLESDLEEIKMNQGRILADCNSRKVGAKLSEYEFRVFSQNGEDGIIQFLVSNLNIKNRTFIEFGIEDFSESNCRFLLLKDNWHGFVIDGSEKNISRLRSSRYYWRHSIQGKSAFVTRENIKTLLDESGFEKELGIMSVDIDGVDYFVLAELSNWYPDILIVEYNALFGKTRAVSVPYDPQFFRTSKHHSNLYYGASLPAFVALANERDYALVGTNTTGNNAFFVKRGLLNDAVREVSISDGFHKSCFREGRDREGKLTFATGNARRQCIAEMQLVDTLTGESLRVGDLHE